MRVRAAALVLSLLILLATGAQVWAHASLVKAEPADGAVVREAPATLKLTFNEPVSPLVMRLISPTGEPIALGDVATENATVTIVAPPDLRRGTHALSWRVISADGHPVAGALLFSIGAPSTPPSADGLGDRSVRAALWAARVVIYVWLFFGSGGALFRAWIGDRASPAPRARS
jgi:copper transport protein